MLQKLTAILYLIVSIDDNLIPPNDTFVLTVLMRSNQFVNNDTFPGKPYLQHFM